MARRGGLFAAWALVGAGAVLGVISLGPFLLLPALALAVLLATRTQLGFEAAGGLAGVAAVALYVAYLHREGPGWHCTSTADSVACGESLDPVPWLVGGFLLAGLSVAALVAGEHRRRRAERRAEQR